jgi:hypothetical protein
LKMGTMFAQLCLADRRAVGSIKAEDCKQRYD